MKKTDKGRSAGLHQMCIAMKLTTLLLTMALMEAHGGGIAQNVSISGQNLSLKKVFSEIKHQTGYAFFYNYDLLREAHSVNLHVKEAPLTQVLKLCFTDQPLDYFIENKTIVITKRAAPPPRPDDGTAIADSTVQVIVVNVEVRGKITDEKGAPVVGASIKVKGEQTGTTSDADGVFSISVPVHATLVISSVGYQTREVVVEKEGAIAIHLLQTNKSIDEVVVTGLGEYRGPDHRTSRDGDGTAGTAGIERAFGDTEVPDSRKRFFGPLPEYALDRGRRCHPGRSIGPAK
jgi:CarboxypepD_reg-like domain/Secretin and TonB N terminus short domain